MPREVLSISVGQCGIQMGEVIWRNYCAEHHIDRQGHIQPHSDTAFHTFFQETRGGGWGWLRNSNRVNLQQTFEFLKVMQKLCKIFVHLSKLLKVYKLLLNF